MFQNNTIRARVMEHIDAYIWSAQKEHDETIAKLEVEHEARKKAVAEKIVNDIVKKFL